ncbi:hypothetical protein H9L13_00060 [Sphingomonas lutea]|uniref:Uncharacterized protein n=1 Tax=Sphingomonas lutea TaxID=1045317 RepID=A0A7G9SHT6_9SPHN|nr:hypothetical protein [Sphingomonas lutea]QNN67411.1 hypothetical protein H9L13_00060 [Sphingomonas lutea]
MIDGVSPQDAAEGLRDQAASCRRLAARARTDAGGVALRAVADQFDTDARRLNPMSERRDAPAPPTKDQPA